VNFIFVAFGTNLEKISKHNIHKASFESIESNAIYAVVDAQIFVEEWVSSQWAFWDLRMSYQDQIRSKMKLPHDFRRFFIEVRSKIV